MAIYQTSIIWFCKKVIQRKKLPRSLLWQCYICTKLSALFIMIIKKPMVICLLIKSFLQIDRAITKSRVKNSYIKASNSKQKQNKPAKPSKTKIHTKKSQIFNFYLVFDLDLIASKRFPNHVISHSIIQFFQFFSILTFIYLWFFLLGIGQGFFLLTLIFWFFSMSFLKNLETFYLQIYQIFFHHLLLEVWTYFQLYHTYVYLYTYQSSHHKEEGIIMIWSCDLVI